MPAGDFPIIRIFEFDISENASPIGSRTVPGGSFAFKQIVSAGCEVADPSLPASSSGTLNFNEAKFSIVNGSPPSHVATKPSVITFNLAASGTAISDMKLFLRDDSALNGSQNVGLDPAFVQLATSGDWLPNSSLPSGAAIKISSTIPETQNVFRQDGGVALVGQDDQNSSEFCYLNLIVPYGFPFGNYGACGSGSLKFGLLFSYWSNEFILNF